MAISGAVRRLGDNSSRTSVAGRARSKRFAELLRRFPELPDMRVLDLGGTPAFWGTTPVRPKHVTVVNLDVEDSASEGMEVLRGDACALPERVRAQPFDLAFSNSLIEHVGGHERRLAFAEQVRGVAPHYWVQTPYRYFPLEPHWLFPGQQFLPVPLRASISRRWKGGHIRSGAESAVADVLWVELLGVTELRHYFPDGDLYRERLLGLTKSITVIR